VLIQMTVRGIALDPITNMPIIILKDVDERKALPIWVGIFEANAIALELEKVSTPPAHDARSVEGACLTGWESRCAKSSSTI